MIQTSESPIVCGTDFSEPAAHAANVAAAIAIRLGVPLLLVHGVDERGEIRASRWPSVMETMRPKLEEEAARLRRLGARVEEVLAGGAPNDGVKHCAESANARLIVLASSCHGTLERWVVGSVAERIAESVCAPTLVLKCGSRIEDWARGGRPLRVFVAADFTRNSDAAMTWAAELLKIGPCKFTVGYVDQLWEERAEQVIHAPPDTPRACEMQEMLTYDLRQKAETYFSKPTPEIRVLPASGRVEARLLELAQDARADLIVVGAHQWHGLSRLRHPSVSRRILQAAPISVACVPARRGIPPVAVSSLPNVSRILVAADFSTRGCSAIPYAFSVLPSGGSVCLLHVARPGESPEPQLAWMRSLLPMEAERPDFHVKVEVIASDNVATAIQDAANRFDADLICIGSHGSFNDAGPAAPSTGRKIIAHSTRPVLVVPKPRS